MANEILQKAGTQFVLADHAADFTTPTAAEDDLTIAGYTDVQWDGTNLLDGSAWAAAKLDFGATRSAFYEVRAALEFQATPTAGAILEFWWAPSASGTAATGNLAGLTGSSAAYSGDGGGTLAESIRQLIWVGSFVCTDLVGVQTAFVGFIQPLSRYGQLVVKNESGASLQGDANEHHIVITGVTDEVQ